MSLSLKAFVLSMSLSLKTFCIVHVLVIEGVLCCPCPCHQRRFVLSMSLSSKAFCVVHVLVIKGVLCCPCPCHLVLSFASIFPFRANLGIEIASFNVVCVQFILCANRDLLLFRRIVGCTSTCIPCRLYRGTIFDRILICSQNEKKMAIVFFPQGQIFNSSTLGLKHPTPPLFLTLKPTPS